MWLKEMKGNTVFLTQWKLCCVCSRMFNVNEESHVIGYCNGVLLVSHFECPPSKGQEDPKWSQLKGDGHG